MLTRQECFKILRLDASAGPNAIKQAYRKLAFELHPDLNPSLHDASRQFQELNEAYVMLMQEYANTSFGAQARSANHSGTAGHEPEPDEKTQAKASRAYQKAKAGFDAKTQGAQSSQSKEANQEPGAGSTKYSARSPSREEIVQDLMNDPFARRVFEDIFSHLHTGKAGTAPQPPKPAKGRAYPHKKQPRPKRAKPETTPMLISAGNKMKDLAGGVKSWLRKQIDEEQVMFLPGESLYPGARIRLQVRHGLADKSRTIEFTLPPEFQIGRPIRLKGLGKHVGNLKGDLYLRVFDQSYEE